MVRVRRMTAQTTDLHEAVIARGQRVCGLRRIAPEDGNVGGERTGFDSAHCPDRLAVQGWKVLLLP